MLKLVFGVLFWLSPPLVCAGSDSYDVVIKSLFPLSEKPYLMTFQPKGKAVVAIATRHRELTTLYVYRFNNFNHNYDDKVTRRFLYKEIKQVAFEPLGRSIVLAAKNLAGTDELTLFIGNLEEGLDRLKKFDLLGIPEEMISEGLIVFFEQNMMFYGTRREAKCRLDVKVYQNFNDYYFDVVKTISELSPRMWKYLTNSEQSIFISHGELRELAVLTAKERTRLEWHALSVNNVARVNDMILFKDTVYVASDLGMMAVSPGLAVTIYIKDRSILMLAPYGDDAFIFISGNHAGHVSLKDSRQYMFLNFERHEEFKAGEYFTGLATNEKKHILFGTNESAVYTMHKFEDPPTKADYFHNNQEIYGMQDHPPFGVIVLGDQLTLHHLNKSRVNHVGMTRGHKIMVAKANVILIAGWGGLYIVDKPF